MSIRVELWELPGPHWRLPIRVVWHAELAEVRVGAGVRLPARMMKVAEDKLQAVGRKVGTNFWLSQEHLEKIAKRSQVEDPEEIIEWYPEHREQKVDSNYRARDFIMGYCSDPCAIVRDPLVAESIYHSFCRYMLHWLLNEEKEVDLIFGKVNAFLLRRNWASAAAKYEDLLLRRHQLLRSSCLNPDPQNIVDRGIAAYFVSSGVTAVDASNKLALYSLDISPTDEFDRFSRLVEKKKKRTAAAYYTTGILVRMKRQLRRVIASYATYLRETRHPNIRLPHYDNSGGYASLKGAPQRIAPPPKPCDAGSALRQAEEQSVDVSVESEDACMPEMSDLQSPSGDVRDAQ